MSRGREAESPLQIPAAGWKDVALRIKGEIDRDHVGLVAAGVAFYGLLAIFPAITALVALAGLVLDPQQVTNQMEQMSGVLPEDVKNILMGQATAVAGASGGSLSFAAIGGALLAVYSASKGMKSLVEGLNIAYEEEEERGFFMKKFVILALTLFLILGLIVGLVAVIAVPAVLSVVQLGPITEILIGAGRWAILGLLTILGLAVVYRFGPCRASPRWRWVTPGAVVACIVWVLASAAFAFYVQSFASYTETFGSLAGVIVLLMWLWISAYVILMGGELNAELEAQTRRDTTVGDAMPMGKRNAAKADNLGTAEAK